MASLLVKSLTGTPPAAAEETKLGGRAQALEYAIALDMVLLNNPDLGTVVLDEGEEIEKEEMDYVVLSVVSKVIKMNRSRPLGQRLKPYGTLEGAAMLRHWIGDFCILADGKPDPDFLPVSRMFKPTKKTRKG